MSVINARVPDLRRRVAGVILGAFAVLALTGAPVAAQDLEKVDPDAAMSDQGIDGDLAKPGTPPATEPAPVDPTGNWSDYPVTPPGTASPKTAPPETALADAAGVPAVTPAATAETYGEDDLIGAAEGVFGKGAEGLAKMIEDLLKKQGRPNAYIVGREAGGAFIVGARYGSGTLHHKVEGDRKVYWTGPSVGFDVGANAANTFVLVYNLYDSEDLFNRFPAGEGQAYFVGGLNASYMRRGDVVLIPIRVGAGLRLGVNAGYMKFSKEQKWVPF